MIDSVCQLGGLTIPERYDTCSSLTSTTFEQKFLYEIFRPNHTKIELKVRGKNFECKPNGSKPFLIAYVKAYNQYFKGNDLWNGDFLSCSLTDTIDRCAFECDCKDSICKLVYLKWMIDYDKSTYPLTNVEVCDINTTGL